MVTNILYPGIADRLLDGDRLRPPISVMVDGVISQDKLRHKLEDDSEVHFVPAFRGVGNNVGKLIGCSELNTAYCSNA